MRRSPLRSSYTVAEWGDGMLRTVTYRGGRVLSSSLPLTGPIEEQGYEVTQRLINLRNRRQVAGSLIVILPSHQVGFRWMERVLGRGTTTLTDAEAAQMMGLSANDVVVASQTYPEGILVAACRKAFLLSYLSPFLKAGLSVRKVVPSLMGLWACISDASGEPSTLMEIRSPTNGLIRVSIAVGSKGVPYRMHSFAFQKEESGTLVTELRRVLAEFQRMSGESVASLFLAGDQGVDEEVLRQIEQRLDLRVERLADRGWGLTIWENLLALIGEQVVRNGNILSFPLPEPEPSVVIRQTWERVTLWSALATFLGLILALIFNWQNRSVAAAVDQLNRDIAAKRQLLARLQKEIPTARLESLQRLAYEKGDPRHHPLDILYYLSKSLPKSVWITELSYLRGSQVVIRGTAVSHPGVTDAAHSLADLRLPGGSRLFAEVQTNYARTVTSGEKTQVEFQITAWLKERTPLIGGRMGLR
ncbi:MAG: PilN domain-containing protein [Armatimonadetes bacterium]|nr:PilN domain-containing protein [Armatimonadota bacterium]MDW8121014.1 PilN domain-containing protein [Armatimonadota bacterium]